MKNIFVASLSFNSGQMRFVRFLPEFGAVDRVSVVTDRDTGQARGFGFVEMSNDAEGQKAINGLNGHELDGRALTVNEARPKEDRSGSRGSGLRQNKLTIRPCS